MQTRMLHTHLIYQKHIKYTRGQLHQNNQTETDRKVGGTVTHACGVPDSILALRITCPESVDTAEFVDTVGKRARARPVVAARELAVRVG